MKFRIFTLGCKVNTYESEGIAAALTRKGGIRVEQTSEADILIINTCSVTGKAGSKSRQLIRKVRKQAPGSRIVVTGCHTALNKPQLEKMPETDLVLEYRDKYRIADILTSDNTEQAHSFPFSVSAFTERTRGFILVQDGCNSYCSYCIIPYIRGNPKSRPVEEIISEAEAQIGSGIPEIVLTGIHTGSYGKDLEEDISFCDVLRKISELPGEFRIRLSSIEINEITEELISLISSSPKICPHLPVPLQSGSDRILSLMNRTYTSGEYLSRIEEVRSHIPGCAVTTDIICGFPGETEGDFENTLQTAEKARFSRIHAFSYSRREGTPAAGMKDQIPREIRQQRVEKLTVLSRKLSEEFAESFTGKDLTVIPENRTGEKGAVSGYSEHYVPVAFPGADELIGAFCRVKAISARDGVITGGMK